VSEIEIPDEAVDAFVRSRYGSTGDGWVQRKASARRDLAAAHPAIRSQVLESVVEDVARALADAAGLQPQHRLTKARHLLGVAGEGEGTPR
jgi:hypothetical protein